MDFDLIKPLALLFGINQINPEIQKQLYDDLFHPSIREIGQLSLKAFHGLGLLIAPLVLMGAVNDRLTRFAAKVAEGVPADHQVGAPPLVAGPVIEKLRFVEEGSVYEEMFLNLMAAAIDRDRQADAHPSFATIIAAMAPEEAFFLFDLAQKTKIETRYDTFLNRRPDKHTRSITSMFYRSDPEDSLIHVINNAVPESKLLPKDVLCAYVDHLQSLGVIQSDSDDNRTMVGLTHFGQHFVRVCLPSKEKVTQIRDKMKPPPPDKGES